jgi:hypothetical protein
MLVTSVTYAAEDEAARTSDSIRLKLYLEKAGVDQKWTTLEGDSQFLNGQAWLIRDGVEADAIRVEAFNLDVPSHHLVVNGRSLDIPLTGSNNTLTYRFSL